MLNKYTIQFTPHSLYSLRIRSARSLPLTDHRPRKSCSALVDGPEKSTATAHSHIADYPYGAARIPCATKQPVPHIPEDNYGILVALHTDVRLEGTALAAIIGKAARRAASTNTTASAGCPVAGALCGTARTATLVGKERVVACPAVSVFNIS
jgi:hypothetical protein